MTKFEEFKAIKGDRERWQWLIKNQDAELLVYLDNDDTFVADTNDGEADIESFCDYIGWSEGVCTLLDIVGVKYEVV